MDVFATMAEKLDEPYKEPIAAVKFDATNNVYEVFEYKRPPQKVYEEINFEMFWTKRGVKNYINKELQEKLDDGWSVDILDIKRHLFRFSVTTVLTKWGDC